MSEQEKKRQSMIFLALQPSTKKISKIIGAKKKFFTEKDLFKEKVSGGLNRKQKEGFLTALAMAIKKDSLNVNRKYANELKVHEKIGRIAIKQDLSPDLNPLNYAKWGILENKTKLPIQILVYLTATVEEWNKMSKEFISKACKLFQRCVDAIIEKKGDHIE